MTLADLPDELLLNIMLRVDSNGLLSLALASRRFRAIAKESLIRTSSVPPQRIIHFINTLHANPKLASKLTHLQLRPMNDDVYEQIEKSDLQFFHTVAGNAQGAYRDMARQATPSSDMSQLIIGLMNTQEVFSSRLALVMAQTTGMKALTVGTNLLDSVLLMKFIIGDLSRMPGTNRGFSFLRSTLGARLEELCVYQEPSLGYAQLKLGLADFSCLKRLEVPSHWIISERSQPHNVLPKGLASLQVFFAAEKGLNFNFEWFEDLLSKTGHFTQLRDLELRFEYNLYSQAWHMKVKMTTPRMAARKTNCLGTLQRWKRHSSAVTVQTTFGTTKWRDVGENALYTPGAKGEKGDLAKAFAYCFDRTVDSLSDFVAVEIGLWD